VKEAQAFALGLSTPRHTLVAGNQKALFHIFVVVFFGFVSNNGGR
jgi:hypothetical protein